MWSLGAQRRKNVTSPLDFSNIREFLTFTSGLGTAVLYNGNSNGNSDGNRDGHGNGNGGGGTGGLAGFELGNELDGGDYMTGSSVAPEQLAAVRERRGAE